MSNNKTNHNIENNNIKIDQNNGKVNQSKTKVVNKNEIINNKIIPKNKNANKKQKVNRNILPPQEKPTFENGKYACKLDEPFKSLLLKPEINDISFIRPNLERIYKEGIEIEMFAYVSRYRKKRQAFCYK